MNAAIRHTPKIGLRSVTFTIGDAPTSHVSIAAANAALRDIYDGGRHDATRLTLEFENGHYVLLAVNPNDQADIFTKVVSLGKTLELRAAEDFGDTAFGRGLSKGFQKLNETFAAFRAVYALDSDDGTHVDVLQYWKERIDRAIAAMEGRAVEFSTTLQDRSDANDVYHSHSFQSATVVGVGADPATTGWDEESLPYFELQFADGVRIQAFEEEIFSNDPRRHTLATIVAGGFAVARELGFAGPFHLSREGSDEQKREFVSTLADFQIEDCAQGDHTPDAYRDKFADAPPRKEAIGRRLKELEREAAQLRNSPHGDEIGKGVVTPHVAAVAAHAVETNRLRSELSAIVFRDRRTTGCVTAG
ncbi:hypothetical protein [Burkholderia sp. Ac-20365]|uniref:hypothetical protein n=1 Tax=Burkholderia sp. Ac-20365 TaxID=2703897 RepID=UPI00197BF413|nr:hypothetical protein [Burkholderia sp. Ac-20365]MBN3760914.1 hypothetical protein [Burkholderia sp. Ac-20365]